MKRTMLSLALLGLLGAGTVAPVLAQVSAAPTLLNYQGRLVTPSGNPVPDGTYSIRFSLWDAASSGTEKWNQTLSGITVKNGTFSVLLNTNAANLFNGNLWLETKIGSDAALTPRQQLVSVAYAMKANSVPDASIGAAQLANDAASLLKVSGGAMSSAGNKIGIGTTSPGMSLEVTAPSYYTAPAIGASNGASRWSYLHVGTADPSMIWNTGSAMRFGIETARGTGYSELMRLTSGGNLGIGTASPGNRLSVNGNADFLGSIAATTASLSSGANKDVFNATSSSTVGTWLNLANSSTGGRNWSILSAGSGNGEGAGTLVFNTQGTVAAQLKQTGEFIANVVTVLGGSDVAEPYHVAPVGGVKPLPGMLVTIDPDKVGQMRVASRAYDGTVAGIISGANGIRPGITLTQKGTVADGEFPVASIGRVWCWCDADTNGSIKPGDLLTSSDTPGHAMKATNRERRDGAVIGKAMSALPSGKGLVLVLVSLK